MKIAHRPILRIYILHMVAIYFWNVIKGLLFSVTSYAYRYIRLYIECFAPNGGGTGVLVPQWLHDSPQLTILQCQERPVVSGFVKHGGGRGLT